MIDTNFLRYMVLGNTVSAYLLSFGLFFLYSILIFTGHKIVLSKLKKVASKTSAKLDDYAIMAFNQNFIPILYICAFFWSFDALHKPDSIQYVFKVLFILSLTVFSVRFVLSFLLFWIENYWINREKDDIRRESIRSLLVFVKIGVWAIAVIVLMDNLGIKVSTLVAGLGLGGVAIAFAAQAILGDIFSYFTIFIDRPFELGDFIVIDQYMGTVENIGLKTTRLRSLTGEQLIFSNTDLTNSRVKNYKRMEKRRALFCIGVTYDTPSEKLRKIPKIIQDIIMSIPQTQFDRSHFSNFADSYLEFETVYYVTKSDYALYRNIQQEINFQVKEALENLSVEFAFPTQTVYLHPAERTA